MFAYDVKHYQTICRVLHSILMVGRDRTHIPTRTTWINHRYTCCLKTAFITLSYMSALIIATMPYRQTLTLFHHHVVEYGTTFHDDAHDVSLPFSTG